MSNGYAGKILRVDLTTRQFAVQTLSENVLRKYIGGTGLGARILYDETSAATEPFSPENRLIFMTGPLVGTRAPNFGRYHVVAKSPLTGIFGEANAGGSFGPGLKSAGYDGVVFTGKASDPVYLFIKDGHTELRSATQLWGADTYTVDRRLKEELGVDIVTCCIGPAGENLVKIAGIMNNGTDSRTAARCGLGAVMGSKNLKAVAVLGSAKVPVTDENTLKESVKEWAAFIKANRSGFNTHGTAGGVVPGDATGELPVRNWTRGNFPGAEKICGETITSRMLTRKYHCAQCLIGCGRTVHVKEGKYASTEVSGPEYESVAMLGSNCLVEDIEAIQMANELCNRYGLDTISTGSVIAFAMEAYEKGLIGKERFGGLEVRWGDPDVLIALVKKIAFREDFGYYLGEGVKAMADHLGGAAHEMAMHVKGLDMPAHDGHAVYGTALQYAIGARGGCHLVSLSHGFEQGGKLSELGIPGPLDRFETAGKGEFIAKLQMVMTMFDSLTGCKFLIYVMGLNDRTLATYTKWINAVTGWDMDSREFLETGKRIINLKRMYNARCGITRKDDVLPHRMWMQRRGSGGAADNLPNLGVMLSDYYEFMGWDEYGIPKGGMLETLGL